MASKPVTGALLQVKSLIGGDRTTETEAALNNLQAVVTATDKLANERMGAVKAQAAQNKTLHAQLTQDTDQIKKTAFAGDFVSSFLDVEANDEAFQGVQEAVTRATMELKPDHIKGVKAAAEKCMQQLPSASGNQEDPGREKQRALCTSALQKARLCELALDVDKLGEPSLWSPEDANKAGALRTKLLFEAGGGTADPTKGGGVNGSWWIQQEAEVGAKADRLFIFKPIDKEESIPGFENGKSSAREVLSKAVGDGLQTMTGLSFNFPPTYLVPVANERLPDKDGKIDQKALGKERLGSLQQLSPAKHGEVRDFVAKDPGAAARVPAAAVQAQSVLDSVMLNTDRHGGNLMVDEGPDGNPVLVPIDNGLAVPTKAGLYGRRTKLGPPHNAIGKLPAADRPFDPETLVRIGEINPDKVAEGITTGVKELAAIDPSAVDGANFDEAAQVAKRSAEFLKVAASRLTPAEMATAYQVATVEIFEAKEGEKAKKFDEAIRKASGERAAAVCIDHEDVAYLDHMAEKLAELGWGPGPGREFDDWLALNSALAYRAFENNLVNPKKVNLQVTKAKQLEQLGAGYELPGYVKSYPLKDQVNTLTKLVEKKQVLNDAVATGSSAKDLPDFKKLNDNQLDQLAVLVKYGGEKELRKDKELEKELKAQGKQLKDLKLVEKAGHAQKTVYTRLGGDAKLKEFWAKNPATADTKILDGQDWKEKYNTLQAALEYDKLGGDNAFNALVGNAELNTPSKRVPVLAMALQERDGLAQIPPDQNPPPSTTAAPDVQLNWLRQQIDAIPREAFRSAPNAIYQEAQQAVAKADPAAAGLLQRLRKELVEAKKDPVVQLAGIEKHAMYPFLRNYLKTALETAKNALTNNRPTAPYNVNQAKALLAKGLGHIDKLNALERKLNDELKKEETTAVRAGLELFKEGKDSLEVGNEEACLQAASKIEEILTWARNAEGRQ
jgi:hypothetical protein